MNGRKVFERNLLLGEYQTRWYVSIITEGVEERIYLHSYSNVDMMKCLKKAWKHYCKTTFDPNYTPVVTAYYETEEDAELLDMGQYWSLQPYWYCEENDIPLPHGIPFM